MCQEFGIENESIPRIASCFAGGIGNTGAVCGAVVGAVVAAIMAYAPKDSRVLWQTLGVLAVCGILVTMMMVRTSQIQSELLNGSGQVLIGSAEQRQHDPQNYH